MKIRQENKKDIAAIQALNKAAFETDEEATLVDLLRQQAQPVISVVAEDAGAIIGHIMFSPVELSGHPGLKIMGLAPMAVLPTHQRKGTGAALVWSGLEECIKLGFGAVVVLGHANYYPRFGFQPSSRFGIDCEYEVPADVFMLKEIQSNYVNGATGTIKYHSAFSRTDE